MQPYCKTTTDLQTALETMQAQGQGIWDITLYSANVLPSLVAAHLADTASCEQQRVLFCFDRLGEAIIEAQADRPRLCLTCHAPFCEDGPWPVAIVILQARHPDSGAIVQAVCADCYDDAPDYRFQGVVLEALCTLTGMDMRQFHSHPAGHA